MGCSNSEIKRDILREKNIFNIFKHIFLVIFMYVTFIPYMYYHIILKEKFLKMTKNIIRKISGR